MSGLGTAKIDKYQAEAEKSKGLWELVKEKPNQHLEALKREKNLKLTLKSPNSSKCKKNLDTTTECQDKDKKLGLPGHQVPLCHWYRAEIIQQDENCKMSPNSQFYPCECQ